MFSLDFFESSRGAQRTIISNNPIEELNNIISDNISRAKVHSYVRRFIPESIDRVQRSLVREDLLERLVRKYAEDPRIREAASNNDVQSILDVLNYEIGGPVLTISNTSIVIDVDALAEIFRIHAMAHIQNLYPENVIMQILSRTVANEQIKVISTNLEYLLTDKGIPVELINEVISLLKNSSRRKRDLFNNLILTILQPQIAAVLTPIQIEFNTIVDNILSEILSFYVPTAPSSFLLNLITNFTNVIVVKVAEVVVVIQTDVNAIFNNLINGTITATARRRRDVDLEYENLYDFSSIAKRVSHKRVTRDVVTDIILIITSPISFIFSVVLSPITNILNAVVKNSFITLLSMQYATIGQLITLPLRFVVNSLVDLILPCTECTSIV